MPSRVSSSSSSSLDSRLSAALESRRQRSILRSLDPIQEQLASSSDVGPRPRSLLDPTPDSTTEPTSLIDFSSNDYLSFGRSSLLRHKFLTSLSSFHPSPFGPPSSRLLDGNSSIHLDLETRLVNFFRAESALLFNSGFDANVGLWSCLPAKDDYIVYDELIHASVHDGMRASRCPLPNRRAFKHNSVEDLKNVLRELVEKDDKVKEGRSNVWVAIETLYSMDGDLSPLKEIVEAVETELPRQNGQIVVDEAHSTGLYGPQGRGVVCGLGLANRITVRLHTFGKAMACTGAVVLAKPLIRSYLINYARTLIFTTAMPYMNVLAMKESIEMLDSGRGDLAANRVHALSTLFINLISTFLTPTTSPISLPPTIDLSPPLPPTASSTPSATGSSLVPLLTTSPIIPLLTSEPRKLSKYLVNKGYLVRPISHPTVPKGLERVRVCLHACNTETEVRDLVELIREWNAAERKRINKI